MWERSTDMSMSDSEGLFGEYMCFFQGGPGAPTAAMWGCGVRGRAGP